MFTGWPGEGSSCASPVIGLVVGTNPPYAITDFITIYPKFGSYAGSPPTFSGVVPAAVLQMYITLASACLAQARWLDMWPMAMALFVAHYATLYLRSEGNPGTTAGQIAASGLEKGIQTSRGTGPISAGSQLVQLPDWGAWAETTYGVQLATLANTMGSGFLLAI